MFYPRTNHGYYTTLSDLLPLNTRLGRRTQSSHRNESLFGKCSASKLSSFFKDLHLPQFEGSIKRSLWGSTLFFRQGNMPRLFRRALFTHWCSPARPRRPRDSVNPPCTLEGARSVRPGDTVTEFFVEAALRAELRHLLTAVSSSRQRALRRVRDLWATPFNKFKYEAEYYYY
jgi:hypothetical protein